MLSRKISYLNPRIFKTWFRGIKTGACLQHRPKDDRNKMTSLLKTPPRVLITGNNFLLFKNNIQLSTKKKNVAIQLIKYLISS